MVVIRSSESRHTETPAGIMTTLASPTQGGVSQSIWRVDMAAGRSGPWHGIDAEQIWTVLSGSAAVDLDDSTISVQAGDTFVIPADARRRLTSGQEGVVAIVVASSGLRAYVLDGTRVSATCAVRDGDKLVPAWIV
jgi:quercetin dioxygenase-like cupin family protein